MDTPAALNLARPPEPALTGTVTPELGEHSYDFYRCERCLGLVTQPQMIRGLADVAEGIHVCPCGGLQFRPTNPKRWEYLLPRVIAFAAQRAFSLLRGARTR